MKDYYSTLGVATDAEVEVIAAAFKAMMRKYHPDVYSGEDGPIRARELNEAYETLRSSSKRRAYDTARGQGPAPNPATPPPPESPRGDARGGGPADHDPQAVSSGYQPTGNAARLAAIVTVMGMLLAIWVYSTQQKADTLASENGLEISRKLDEPISIAASVNPGLIEEPTTIPSEAVPTLGQFSDTAQKAVQDFENIAATGELGSAEAYSQNCRIEAGLSIDILKTDYCVAFDMAGLLAHLPAIEAGQSKSEYFIGRANQFEGDYVRFSQAHPNRADLIWNEVKGLILASTPSN